LQIDSGNFKSDKKLKQQFDWQEMLETGSYKKDKWQMQLVPGVQNRLTSLISLRLDLLNRDEHNSIQNSFVFPVSYKGKVNNDVYKIIAEEKLETPTGEYATLKIEKTHSNKSRISYYWLAKKLDYIPIRIRQLKDGKEQADMLIKSINLN